VTPASMERGWRGEPNVFTGDWEVARIIEAKKDGYQRSLEIKYPQRMTLHLRDG